MKKLINDILNSLDNSLLKKEFISNSSQNSYSNHCYIATEALYHLLDENTRKLYTPSILKVNNITHWFLKNKKDGSIIDITKEQFNFDLDYSKSQNKFFLTPYPSKRALILINRVYEKNCC